MLHKGMQKNEIEDELKGKGDFVKIDWLTRFLKEDLPVDIKKFVNLKLAEIYGIKSMFSDAARAYDSAAIYSIAFSEKIKHYVSECEMYIKANMFQRADEAMKKAFAEGTASDRAEIYFLIKEFYKRQAVQYEKDLRRGNAVRVYEKLMEMNLSDQERLDIKKKLLALYETLGKVKELRELERKK